jgi:hypothetical protein
MGYLRGFEMTHTIDTLMALADKCIATYAYHGTTDYMIVDDGKARATLHAALTEALAKGTQIVRTLEPIDTYLEPVQQVGKNVHIVGCVNHDCALCKARAVQTIGCTSNCENCTYAHGSPAHAGYCYMFYEEPQGDCGQWKNANIRDYPEKDNSAQIVVKESLSTQSAQPVREPMTDEQIVEIAHRRATKYTHRSDPESHAYGFVKHTLIDFARAIESARGIGSKP